MSDGTDLRNEENDEGGSGAIDGVNEVNWMDRAACGVDERFWKLEGRNATLVPGTMVYHKHGVQVYKYYCCGTLLHIYDEIMQNLAFVTALQVGIL